MIRAIVAAFLIALLITAVTSKANAIIFVCNWDQPNRSNAKDANGNYIVDPVHCCPLIGDFVRQQLKVPRSQLAQQDLIDLGQSMQLYNGKCK